MVKNLIGKLKLVLPFIGLGILAYIIYSLDLQKITSAFLSIDPIYIVYALLHTIPLLVIRNVEYQIILKEQKITVRYLDSMKIYLIGIFYGSFTPGYSGQLMRIPYLKEKTGEPFGKLFINTIIDTFVHSFSIYGMIIIGAFLVVGTIPELFPVTMVWMIGFCLAVLYFSGKERGENFFRVIITHLIPKKVKPHLNAFVDTFYSDFPRFKVMIIPYLIGIITWVIVFSQEYLILLGLGLEIPYLTFLALYPIANVAGFIPITFGGLGTREFTAILIFTTLFTVTAEQILVLSLVGFLITDIFLAFLGFLLSLKESRSKTSFQETAK
ncbi:MAG TPA: lysylphosphatidylglycerol synthase transmembrane domain-containing protein [Candidatus Thermoplasmatota archaeon]|nr:lysylphosphatidylglycerol synthase transmembrane domain-containing protein [Candidatus Thermoplasmatota archaeon]